MLDLTFYIAMKKVHFYYSDFMIMVVCSIDWQFSENLIYNFIYSRALVTQYSAIFWILSSDSCQYTALVDVNLQHQLTLKHTFIQQVVGFNSLILLMIL